MTNRFTDSLELSFSFGPFRLIPARQLLLEGEATVRLGSRAFELLVALVERPGELISKDELMNRVWPDTVIEESNLKVHVSALRRALGDGQPGRRYLANVPGRGYRFVASVHGARTESETVPGETSLERAGAHNLRIPQIRAIGRSDTIGMLAAQLLKQRLTTVVGAAGIGKTTVALAVAASLIPVYEHGVWLVDLAPLDDERLVPSTVASTLGVTGSLHNATEDLTSMLRNKHMLVVLDNCEHVAEASATLIEHLVAGLPGIDILATSREPLRAKGERVHRLFPLEVPPTSSRLTASEAIRYSSVQLFVERAAANSDGFELSDDDAPLVAEICRQLDGLPLAIELAAARVEALGVRQLSSLLEDRFRVLNQGRRTALPRHQSLRAALDWSYDYLSEAERAVWRRLSVFAGAFTLESAIAVAGGGDVDVVEGIADLVAKSLITADADDLLVRYRMLETTRAYAMQKLVEKGEAREYAERHAQYHRKVMERAEDDWRSLTTAEWLERYDRNIGDVRGALKWAYSRDGDPTVGVELTIAALPLWYQSGLMAEYQEYVNQALAGRAAQPYQEMKLLDALGQTTLYDRLPEDDSILTRALVLAESLAEPEYQFRSLGGLYSYYTYKGDFNKAHISAERAHAIAAASGNGDFAVSADALLGVGFRYLGDYGRARQHLDRVIRRPLDVGQSVVVGYRFVAQGELSNVLWLQGFADQATSNLKVAIDYVQMTGSRLLPCLTLANATCPLALFMGDLAAAETSVQQLLELSAGKGFTHWGFQARCLQGALLVARGDASGLTLLRTGLSQLRGAGFGFSTLISLYYLAEGLRNFGEIAEAHASIDQALHQSDQSGERWCMPELLRIKGEILRSDPSAARSAEEYFLQSLDHARRQEALSWELRAATSLARFRYQMGEAGEAHNLLSQVYRRFTEGFETGDLRAARALMDEIGKNMSEKCR